MMANYPREEKTLVASLIDIARRVPDAGALICGDRRLSYDALGKGILATSEMLRGLGVGLGDRVVIIGPNSVEIAVTYFAIHAAGAITVPVAPETSQTAIDEIVRDSDPRLVLATEPERVPISAVEDLGRVVRFHGDVDVPILAAAQEPADLLYTSGTTGRRKGVLLTHAAIAAAAANINSFVGTCADDVEVVPIPLSHSFGLGRLRCSALVGHTLCLEPGMRNPALVFKRLLDVRATGLAMVPAGLALLRRIIGEDLARLADRLRYIEIGSARLDENERQWLLQLLPRTRICHHYGLTEASRSAFKELHETANKPTTVGRPSPNVTMCVATEDGEDVPPGQHGEILVRGGMLMREYWRQSQATADALVNGWLRTGDIGYVDEDGDLFLVSRKDDMLNIGGRKVAPADIEVQLRQYPGIQDAACIGVADPAGVLGVVVKAFLVASIPPDVGKLVTWLRERLPEYQIPRQFELVHNLPKTNSGKIRRHVLRTEHVASGPSKASLPDPDEDETA